MDWKKIIDWLNQPVLNLSITIFRIVFAFVLLIQTYYFFTHGFIENNIIKPFILFPFINNLQPLSEFYLISAGYLMLIGNIGMLFNKTSRIATLIFLLCFTYFWLLDKSYYNNHYYFISIVCFLLFIVDRNSNFKATTYVPRISILSLQLMIVIIYLVGGINKLNPYWLIDFQPMSFILETKCDQTENMLFINPVFIAGMSYFGLLFDLLIGFILLFRKTRIIGFMLVLVFNIVNHFLFTGIGEIGIFPFVMISTLILFIDPYYLCKIFRVVDNPKNLKKNPQWINIFIFLFILIQLLLPFRHIFFKGYVDYNGIGQRFSWRMKTMCKESLTPGIIQFKVYREAIDPATNKRGGILFLGFNLNNMEKFLKTKLDIKENLYLTNNQREKLLYYPDLLPQFAKNIEHILHAKILEKYNNDLNFLIYAEANVKFMHRTPQNIINSSIDLTSLNNNSINTNQWLIDLKQKPWAID
tara:strand:- start:994 stop:2406 length:1413 start_codon:yes stop_codon:yes gene_type:complete